MKKSTASALLEQLSPAARRRFRSDAAWAQASGLPRETLSRLKRRDSCDLGTLTALARAAGCALVALPDAAEGGRHLPQAYGREYEDALLELVAAGNTEPAVWRAYGPAYFMGGLAVLLAGARGFDRGRHLRLAEALHPGMSTPEVFGQWLERSPLRPARFLPMARRRKAIA